VVVTDENPPVGIDVTRPSIARFYDCWLGGKDSYEADRRFAERLLAVVPDAQAAARANKNFLARAVGFLVEEAGIRQVRCRDCGRSSRARLCGPRAEADTAMDPSLWCDVTKDPYLSCARALLD